jgi:hypothetical protein
LEQTLGEAVVLPERKIDDVAAFFARFPQVKNLFIDGQERPTQRPKDANAQTAHYSGKKKRHTRKNIVVSDAHRRICHQREFAQLVLIRLDVRPKPAPAVFVGVHTDSKPFSAPLY